MDIKRIKDTFTIPSEFIREFRRRSYQFNQTGSLVFNILLAFMIILTLWIKQATKSVIWTDSVRTWYILLLIVAVCSIAVLIRLRSSIEYLKAATIVSVVNIMAGALCMTEAAMEVAKIEGHHYLNNNMVLLCFFVLIFVVRLDLRITLSLQFVIAVFFIQQSFMISNSINFREAVWNTIIGALLAMMSACVFISLQIRSFMGEKNLEDLASCDALTRVHNRRGFDVMFNRVLQDARVTNSTVSLLIIDIDKFKNYNDLYGHVEGDRCLAAVAKSITGSVRKTDFVARYGGEEFAVIMENTPREAAERAANQMLEDIRSRQIRHEGSEIGILTFSVGGVTFQPSQLSSTDYYVKMADEGLYMAKETGRNRVIFNRQSM